VIIIAPQILFGEFLENQSRHPQFSIYLNKAYYMKLAVINSRVAFSSRPNFERENVTFQVLPEGRGKITIGSQYVFGKKDASERSLNEASGRFHIEKINNDNKHLFMNGTIGYVKFFEEVGDEFGQYSYPPIVNFSVYLPEERYLAIKNAVLSGQPVVYLVCGVVFLDFSWEPDGSHRLWKLKENESLVSHSSLVDLGITDFDIGFGSHFDDEYHVGVNAETPLDKLITKEDIELFKASQKRTQQYLAVIAVAIVFITLIFIF
jgi:hypothetical protein